MGIRTYLPALIAAVRVVCLYTARYDAKIRANLTAPQLTVYDLLRSACDAFMVIMPTPPQGD